MFKYDSIVFLSMEKILINGKEIILVGTAHISSESIKEVQEVIESQQPNLVGIELDASRYEQLLQGTKWQETNLSEIINSGKTYLFLLNLLLSNIQRSFGESVGVKPGAEMLEAVNIAQQNKIPILLLDRDVRITFKRALTLMKFSEKLRLLLSIFTGMFAEKKQITKQTIEKLKQKDMMTELMQELSKTAPTIKKVLVDERDMFIANSINTSNAKKIVAVVGAGHVEGIQKYLGTQIDTKEITTIPKKIDYFKIISWGLPVILVALFVAAFFTKGFQASLELIIVWFLVHGILSGLGVLLARGHWLSALTAFIASPFTALHPAIAAGWFAGYVEARVRQPKVKDFEALNKLNSFGDFSRNQVTRILLVTAFANIGSSIATFIFLPYIFAFFA